MSKICQNCNSILSDNHKFCTKCGAKIVDKIEKKTVVSDNKNNLITKESTGTYYKIGAFLILIGIVLFFGLNKNNNAIPQEEIIKKKSEQQPIIKKEVTSQIEKKYTIINSSEITNKINDFLTGFIHLLTDEEYYSIQYIDDVIYYDWGKTKGLKAHNDKINLIKKWPYLRYSVRSIDSIKQDESGNYIIEFKLNFKSWNFKRKGFQGIAQYRLVITKYMTQVLEENSKVLFRESYNPIFNDIDHLPFVGKKRFDEISGHTNIIELKKDGKMKIINGHYRSGGWHISYEGNFINYYSKTKLLFHSDAVCDEKYNDCLYLSDTNENADEYLE